jgi:hypothetical protein
MPGAPEVWEPGLPDEEGLHPLFKQVWSGCDPADVRGDPSIAWRRLDAGCPIRSRSGRLLEALTVDTGRMDGHRDLASLVGAALLAHRQVRAVELVGSRAAGTTTPLSDWDFRVQVAGAFAVVAAALPRLVSVLAPLAGQWDRLSSHQCYMLMLDGPVKVDLLFVEQPHRPEPPWVAGPETLAGIDAHLWDWVVWLVAKQHAGKDELVGSELARMHDHLLGPMGVGRAPVSIPAAVAAYRGARDRLEARFGVRVSRRLEEAVLPVVTAAVTPPGVPGRSDARTTQSRATQHISRP